MKIFKSFCFFVSLLTTSAALAQYECHRSAGAYSAQGYEGLQAVSYETALSLYEQLKSPRFGIDYQNAKDGCDGRARTIHSSLKQAGLESLQAFIQTEAVGGCGATGASCMNGGAGAGNVIGFQSIYNDDYYTWEYHTAPVICVHRGRRAELYVLDLSTFRTPVPLKEWESTLSSGLYPEEYSVFVRPFNRF